MIYLAFLLGVVCGALGLVGWFILALWLEDRAERDRRYGQ